RAVLTATDRDHLAACAGVDTGSANDRDPVRSRLPERRHPRQLATLQPERAEAGNHAALAARGHRAGRVQGPGVLPGTCEQLAGKGEHIAHRGRLVLTAERW